VVKEFQTKLGDQTSSGPNAEAMSIESSNSTSATGDKEKDKEREKERVLIERNAEKAAVIARISGAVKDLLVSTQQYDSHFLTPSSIILVI